MKKIILVLMVITALTVSGCANMNKTQKGAAWGSAVGTVVGAGVGYAIGGKEGAAIGAGAGLVVGGLSGAAVGRYMDNQEAEMRQALADAEAASIKREQDILVVSFKGDFVFDHDSSVLKTGAYDELDRVANVLIKYPQTRINIEGHTDSTGTEEYNMALSRKRAEAVKTALIGKGLTPARLQTIGFGESKPVATNDTPEGRQLNRRVRVVIVPIRAE